MTHDYHPTLPGYDERQIWFDGCEECERRGSTVPDSIGMLDDERLTRSWNRMISWVGDDFENLGRLSRAELPLLRFLESVRLVKNRLERLT